MIRNTEGCSEGKKKLVAGVYEEVVFWIARNDKTKHDGRKWNI